MVKKEIITAKEVLLELLKDRSINVKKIVVFGSYIRNKHREDSDMDIIVVSTNFRNKDIFEKVKMTRGIHRELVRRVKKPFDIMYYSDKEWGNSLSLIANMAKNEGKVIYAG